MPKKALDFFNKYKVLASASKFGVKKRVNSIIDLYNSRKIYNIKTATALLDQLTDKKKKNVDIGIKKYSEVYDKFQNAEPLNVRHKRLRQEKVERKTLHEQTEQKKLKSVLKIQNLLRNTILFDIISSETSMGKKVLSFTLKPQRIGKNLYLEDLKTILYKAYYRVLKLLPKKAYFYFYTELNLGKRVGRRNLTSNSYTFKQPAEWARHVAKQIEMALQSDETVTLKEMEITFNFFIVPVGGKSNSTQSRDRESILNKTSVARIDNDDNNCFWYALSRVFYKGVTSLKDNRNLKIREKYAKELCRKCKLPWDKEVSFLEIPLIEEALDCNIYIADMANIPILGSKIDVWNMLMYKDKNRGKEHYWLLFDDSHYHAITNIKGFLSVEYFCNTCFQCFWRKAQFESHDCKNVGCKKVRLNKDSKNHKELAHYLHPKICKGSKEELQQKLNAARERESNSENGSYDEESITDRHNRERYIIYDFETDTSTSIHRPNHVEVDILEVDTRISHNYDDCLTDSLAFNGYGCEDKFCDWLFAKENQGSTVIAHNGAGYDNKFVLKWCISKGRKPDVFIRQGSKIAYMGFSKFNIRFVDSCNFFKCPLKALSETFSIDTLKGHFPHYFNTEENQNYIGKIPDEKMFGAREMTPETYEKDFQPWYKKVKDTSDWNFKEELIKYCRADVVLLAKAVLKFRHLFLDTVDTDPFRYVTLASLCISIYRNRYMPENTIVSHATDKTVSIVSKEWLYYLNDKNLIPEYPIFIEDGKEKRKFTVDAIDRKNRIIKEFNGCYWHGCPKCHPENKAKYEETIKRKELLEKQGYRVDEMWQCDWEKLKGTLPDRFEIEQAARDQNINVRDSLFGGRTEAFKSYHKCNKHQKIYHFDVVSLYPTVNALDDYAIGFKKYVKIEPLDILNDKFFGIAKVDILPPKDLYIPVLPDNSDGKLLFHLKPLIGKTYSSVELKKALEKGYTITHIYSALEYKKHNGLMKKYVETFIKIKVENSGVKTQEECDEINKAHKELGFEIEIKPENTSKNPGLRAIAKLCLNSLWGKFGQRSNLSNYDFYYDYNKLLTKMNCKNIVEKRWHIVNDGCVELKYVEDKDMTLEAEYISEVTAVFTTANARVRLYDMLDWLDPSQVLYVDTDSIFFIYDETNPKHKKPENDESNPKTIKFGKGLGEWEDEHEGHWITEIVIAGAKSYAYKLNDGTVDLKQKGITLDRNNSELLDFDTYRDMVLNHNVKELTEQKDSPFKWNEKNESICIETSKRYQFVWDNNTKDIVTKYISRSVRATIGEKRVIDGYDTYPFS